MFLVKSLKFFHHFILIRQRKKGKCVSRYSRYIIEEKPFRTTETST